MHLGSNIVVEILNQAESIHNGALKHNLNEWNSLTDIFFDRFRKFFQEDLGRLIFFSEAGGLQSISTSYHRESTLFVGLRSVFVKICTNPTSSFNLYGERHLDFPHWRSAK
jgi:hypothetical protein